MGKRGPVPKRSNQRRRVNKPVTPPAAAPGAPAVPVPKTDDGWHPVARSWFEALAASGQAVFYEPSDWATAVVIAEAISRELNPQPMLVGRGEDAHVEMVSLPPKGASLAAWLKAMSTLLVMEGDRRRVQLELTRPATGAGEEVAGVSELDEYRRRLNGSAS